MVGDLEFVSRLVEDRSARLREDVLALPATANRALQTLLIAILDRLDGTRAGLPYVYDADDPEVLPLLIERVDIVRRQVDQVHALLGTYRDDLTRRHPVGLRHLVINTVATVVERPLGLSAIPLIHLDPRNRYATYDLITATWTLLTSDVNVSSDEVTAPEKGAPPTSRADLQWRRLEPVLHHKAIVINVPALDPANAFLAPVLAHEVAHVAADHRLLSVLLPRLDQDAANELFQAHVPPRADTTRGDQILVSRDHLVGWLREELCDAVACAVTGPAFLFAAAANLPVTGESGFNLHPPPRDRLRWALRFLDRLGWHDYLTATVPRCYDYLAADRQTSVPEPEPYETFVRETVDHHVDLVLDVVLEHLPEILTPDGYFADDRRFGIVEAFRLGYVPALEGATPNLWAVLLAGWIAWLADDDPLRIPAAVADAGVNAFLIKTLELVEITELWLSPS